MKSIISFFKSRIQKHKRKRIVSMLLKSRMVSEGTESCTLSRMASEILRYIDTGEYDSHTLPNGYRWMGER